MDAALITAILALVIAVLAFARDLFGIELDWLPVRDSIRRNAHRIVYAAIILLIGITVLLLQSQIRTLESKIVDQNKEMQLARATQAAQAHSITSLETTCIAQVTEVAVVHATATAFSSLSATVSDSISIKTIPLSVSTYSSEDDPKYGEGSGSAILTIDQNSNFGTNYKLAYSLPMIGEGYAGVAFRFAAPQDFRAYRLIEVTITFDDDRADCDLILIDTSTKAAYLRLGGLNPPTVGSTKIITGNQHTIRMPLEASFDDINMQSIREIDFSAGTDSTRGDHGFTLHDVKLIK